MHQPIVYDLAEDVDEGTDGSSGFVPGSDSESVVFDDSEVLDNFFDIGPDTDPSGHSSDVAMNDAGEDLDDIAIRELVRNTPHDNHGRRVAGT